MAGKPEEIVRERMEVFLAVALAAALLFGHFDLPSFLFDAVVSLGIGFILGGFATAIVVAFGGEVLKDIEVGIYGVSITAFTVVTLLVRHTLF